ncbi:MAG: hypothetical protein KAX49_14330 [Halanaerobiales bacterium]|nr:hypothetical protein [Halanaerobiales bacterium]
MVKLKRLSDKPVLTAKKEHEWEAAAVFNCATIHDNGLVHMIYRAADIAPNGKEGEYINRLGYAVSKDGINFNRLEQPIFENATGQEARGAEDPRIVKMEDTFYMMYTGYGGREPGDYRICLATSQNLIDWKRHGVVLDEPNKDASLFPEKINGKYVMFHRREPDIWIAYSDDLEMWYGHTIIMEPVEGSVWENKKIGIAGPPIKTDDGWLLIYHGVNDKHVYTLGVALLDLNDPSKVIARQAEPVLEPELDWERNGHIPNVVFGCGHAEIDDRLLIYYAGADTAIGVAELDIKNLKFD